jgi:hypothetical protein
VFCGLGGVSLGVARDSAVVVDGQSFVSVFVCEIDFEAVAVERCCGRCRFVCGCLGCEVQATLYADCALCFYGRAMR